MQTILMNRNFSGIVVAATMAALLGVAGTAQAAFKGRDASGAPSGSCTATGAGKCTYFYDTALDITILNDWNIGKGAWSAIADPGSAQALAASAGLTASGLTGWVLPTGDPNVGAGAQNQYGSIWSSVGGTFAGLSSQFDGVQQYNHFYWSGSEFDSDAAWHFLPGHGYQWLEHKYFVFGAVAVRPGDVAAVPEPETGAMFLLGLGAMVVAVRRRPS